MMANAILGPIDGIWKTPTVTEMRKAIVIHLRVESSIEIGSCVLMVSGIDEGSLVQIYVLMANVFFLLIWIGIYALMESGIYVRSSVRI